MQATVQPQTARRAHRLQTLDQDLLRQARRARVLTPRLRQLLHLFAQPEMDRLLRLLCLRRLLPLALIATIVIAVIIVLTPCSLPLFTLVAFAAAAHLLFESTT